VNKKNTGVQEFRSSGVQEFRSSGVQDSPEREDLPGDIAFLCCVKYSRKT
jgi:hypothetical protein